MRQSASRRATASGLSPRFPLTPKGPGSTAGDRRGRAEPGETSFPVKVTPSGIGWLATLACLLPFVVLGALWLRGALRQRPSGAAH